MCGRYYIDETDEAMSAYLAAARAQGFAVEGGEMFPGRHAPIVKSCGTGAGFWGYPVSGRPLVNIRSETVEERSFCRESFFARRCAIPCSGFYEWDGYGEKYLFGAGKRAYLGGVYLCAEDEDCFAVLTAGAVGAAFQIHERMPVILTEADAEYWLYDSNFARRYIAGGYAGQALCLTGVTSSV